MNAPPTPTLAARLHAVRAALASQVDETVGPEPEPTGRDGLERLVHRCALSPFERDVLVLVAGVELDDTTARLCARVTGDPNRSWATFGLALRVLADAHWDALAAEAPLRALALVVDDRRNGGGITTARLAVDDRVLLAVLGLDTVDDAIAEFATVLDPGDSPLAPTHAGLLDWLCGSAAGTVWLRGAAAHRRAFAQALAHRRGAPRAWELSASGLPADVGESALLVRRLAREHRMTASPVVLTIDEVEPDEMLAARRIAHRLAGAGVPLIVSSPDPVSGLPEARHVIDLDDIPGDEEVGVWRAALGPVAASLNGRVERLAGQFRLSPGDVRAVAADIDPDDEPDVIASRLWATCRLRARADMDGLARRVVPTARWDDLVLPESTLAALRDLLRHARHRHTVFDRWNIAGSGGGRGVAALFAGPSGTGKSLAAEVIAGELEVDVYRVDLSQIVSKYIGETEKNLRRVTDAAEQSGAVLVFDEADALFGQRSEVKDSHDRYANIEVSYLLQRMELYRGLAVLTTNLRANIDDAFVRRLSFIVEFPFPDTDARRALWERAFGARVPVGELDLPRLAQLTLAGGNIRNVAVHAAFLAAERGDAITMADLLRGAHSEYAKLERPLTPAELTGWAP